MRTCSFIIHLKEINVCSKVFVECTICYDELKEASSSSFLLASLTPRHQEIEKSLHLEFVEL